MMAYLPYNTAGTDRHTHNDLHHADSTRAVRLRLFEDPVRRTTAYSTVWWRTTVVMRLEQRCRLSCWTPWQNGKMVE
jgi:hypothetical protein